MSSHNVLVLPFPAQSHVNCLMILSNKLSQNGLKITFVNSDFNHKRVVKAMNEEKKKKKKKELALELVSIPDGMGPEDDRNDMAKLSLAILRTMPFELEKLIEGFGGRDRISCVVADVNMAWALEVSFKKGIKAAVICPTSASLFALELHMPKLIQDGMMDSYGLPILKGEFQISPEIPKMNTAEIAWCCMGDTTSQKTVYDYIAKMIRTLHLTEWWLCNTTFELEPGAFSLYPKILPIGPLMENHEENPENTRSLGQFWEEDLSCLKWLDQQPPCSVIYVAFGSITMFDPTQFQELALGLDLTQRPFLWVVREDTYGRGTKVTYPDEFEGKKGKIFKWVPQKKILSHPSIACFVSHCGWNSTMEGLSNGVPFLCWPYFADQFFDKSCICNEWKVGLGFASDDKGVISRHEIKKKVDMLLEDESIRARSLKLKNIIMSNIAEGGTSMENFKQFLKWVKQQV